MSAGHASQDVADPTADLNCPEGQALQLPVAMVLPAMVPKKPGWQRQWSADVERSDEVLDPLGHEAQDVFPESAWKVPEGQLKHCLGKPPLIVPAGHSTIPVFPLPLNPSSAKQSLGWLEPDIDEEFAGHAIQLDADVLA